MEPAVIALLVVSGLLLVLGLISLMLGAGQARPKEKVEDGEDAIEPVRHHSRLPFLSPPAFLLWLQALKRGMLQTWREATYVEPGH